MRVRGPRSVHRKWMCPPARRRAFARPPTCVRATHERAGTWSGGRLEERAARAGRPGCCVSEEFVCSGRVAEGYVRVRPAKVCGEARCLSFSTPLFVLCPIPQGLQPAVIQ